MLLDYLEKLAVPIVLALIGAGAFSGFRLSRRSDPNVQPLPPVSPPGGPVPAAAPEPDNEDEVEAWLYAEVRRLVLADAANTATLASNADRITGLEAGLEQVTTDLDVIREATVPLVKWLDANPNHTAPRISAKARRLLGLDPEGLPT